jgi:hypothetical protein
MCWGPFSGTHGDGDEQGCRRPSDPRPGLLASDHFADTENGDGERRQKDRRDEHLAGDEVLGDGQQPEGNTDPDAPTADEEVALDQ